MENNLDMSQNNVFSENNESIIQDSFYSNFYLSNIKSNCQLWKLLCGNIHKF